MTLILEIFVLLDLGIGNYIQLTAKWYFASVSMLKPVWIQSDVQFVVYGAAFLDIIL